MSFDCFVQAGTIQLRNSIPLARLTNNVPGQMLHGQMLHGQILHRQMLHRQMVLGHLSTVKDGSTNYGIFPAVGRMGVGCVWIIFGKTIGQFLAIF